MFHRLLVCVLGLVLSACGSGGGGFAAPGDGGPPISEYLVVTTLDDDGPGSLRQTVADALPGAQISFDPAIETGMVTLNSQIEIEKSLRIIGAGETEETVIYLDSQDRAFFISDAPFVRLEGLQLASCFAPGVGGAMFVGNSNVQLSRVRIFNSESGFSGGALQAATSTLHFDRCHVGGCLAGHGGGLYLLQCETLVTSSSMHLNWALAGPGGAVMTIGGTFVARSSTFHDNTAVGGTPDDFGGAICALAAPSGCHLGLYGCTITGNEAAEGGGGVYLDSNGSLGDFVCRQTIIADNTSPFRPDFAPNIAWTTTTAYNLIGSLDVGAIVDGVNGNMVGDSGAPLGALLGPLEEGIFPTLSRAPLLGSLVNNAVPHDQSLDESGLPLAMDQRFTDRFGDSGADIGAVEFNP